MATTKKSQNHYHAAALPVKYSREIFTVRAFSSVHSWLYSPPYGSGVHYTPWERQCLFMMQSNLTMTNHRFQGFNQSKDVAPAGCSRKIARGNCDAEHVSNGEASWNVITSRLAETQSGQSGINLCTGSPSSLAPSNTRHFSHILMLVNYNCLNIVQMCRFNLEKCPPWRSRLSMPRLFLRSWPWSELKKDISLVSGTEEGWWCIATTTSSSSHCLFDLWCVHSLSLVFSNKSIHFSLHFRLSVNQSRPLIITRHQMYHVFVLIPAG